MASAGLCRLNITRAPSTLQNRVSRRQARVFAQADDQERKLSFKSNDRAALGYTDSDSAGQTNIFAVEPKLYVAGSTSDGTADAGASTTGAAAIAGSVAVGTVLAGLLLIKDADTVDVGPIGDYKSLNEYKAQFAAELAIAAPPAAPAVADE